MKKRILSFILAIAVIVTGCFAGAAGVAAEEYDFSDGVLAYSYANKEKTELAVNDVLDSSVSVITIPEEYNGIPVTAIDSNAFSNEGLNTRIEFPSSLTEIRDYAFLRSEFNEADLSDCTNLKSIGCYAFAENKRLTAIALPDCVTQINSGAFNNCTSLSSVNIPKSLNNISLGCFSNTALETVTIPSNIKKIYEGAFKSCAKLKSLTIENGVSSISIDAFAGTAPEYINIPASVSWISDEAFADTKGIIKEINIDPSNKSYTVCNNMICSKDLTSVVQIFLSDTVTVLPDSITEIGNSFYNNEECQVTQRILIPDTVPVEEVDGVNPRRIYGFPYKANLYITENSPCYSFCLDDAEFLLRYNVIVSNTDSMKMDEIAPVNSIYEKPEATVYTVVDGERVNLTKDEDYILCYMSDTYANDKAVAYAIGINDYEGQAASAYFVNNSHDLSIADITVEKDTYQCTGSEIKPEISVSVNGAGLSENTDYTVSYIDNIKPGTASIIINGIGDYTGTETIKFNIFCDHDYDCEEMIQSCTSWGGYVYTCKFCGDTYNDVKAQRLEHQFEYITVDASCTEDGYNQKKCTLCGYTETTVISSPGEHKYYKSVQEPTCYEEGRNTFTCSRCGDTYYETIPKLEHNETEDFIPPTCSETGHYCVYCSNCGKIFVSETIPTTNHKYGEWIIDVPATCGENGTRHRICENCGCWQNAVAPATGEHRWMPGHTDPATVQSNGCEFVTCDVCGEYKYYYYIWRIETIETVTDNYVYDGKVHKPNVIVKDYQGNIIPSSNYTLTYESSPKSVGTHKVLVKFDGKRYSGNATLTYRIISADSISVKLSRNAITANGTVQRPTVTVTDKSGKKLTYKKDFVVDYSNWNSTDVGRYTVTVKLINSYSGSYTFPYYINPKPTSFLSSDKGGFKAIKNGFVLSWNKQNSQTTGYQIQYATKKDFSNAASYWVTDANTTTATITKRAGGTRYYVRIRTYRKIGNGTFYSTWNTGLKSVVTLK